MMVMVAMRCRRICRRNCIYCCWTRCSGCQNTPGRIVSLPMAKSFAYLNNWITNCNENDICSSFYFCISRSNTNIVFVFLCCTNFSAPPCFFFFFRLVTTNGDRESRNLSNQLVQQYDRENALVLKITINSKKKALVLMMTNSNELIVANVGDCRAVMCKRPTKAAINVTHDQTPQL